jgi:hypothetical protein
VHAPDDDTERLRRLYVRVYGRPPSAVEMSRAAAFLDRVARRLEAEEPAAAARRLRAWQALCQTILASNEFIYID